MFQPITVANFETVLDIKRSLADLIKLNKIESLPYDDWTQLSTDIRNSQIKVRAAPSIMSALTAAIYIDKSHQTIISLITFLVYIVPVAAIVLAIFVHWAFVFGILLSFVFFSISKKIFYRKFFAEVFGSESVFCLSFHYRFITVELPNGEIVVNENIPI